MWLEALFLALSLNENNTKQKSAARKVKPVRVDEDRERQYFFDKQRRWGYDKFIFMGKIGSNDGKKYSWIDILKKLDLLEEGYWCEGRFVSENNLSPALKEHDIDKRLHWKIVPEGYNDFRYYLKLSDINKDIPHVENSKFDFVKWTFNRYGETLCDLVLNGKVTIGVPLNTAAFSIPCQEMTFQEAREFMAQIMEDMFQKYYNS